MNRSSCSSSCSATFSTKSRSNERKYKARFMASLNDAVIAGDPAGTRIHACQGTHSAPKGILHCRPALTRKYIRVIRLSALRWRGLGPTNPICRRLRSDREELSVCYSNHDGELEDFLRFFGPKLFGSMWWFVLGLLCGRTIIVRVNRKLNFDGINYYSSNKYLLQISFLHGFLLRYSHSCKPLLECSTKPASWHGSCYVVQYLSTTTSSYRGQNSQFLRRKGPNRTDMCYFIVVGFLAT